MKYFKSIVHFPKNKPRGKVNKRESSTGGLKVQDSKSKGREDRQGRRENKYLAAHSLLRKPS